MNPRTNPYAPGAGTQPPELTGREALIEKASIALDRSRNGLSARGILMVGLRGVGKTVLLTRIAQDAETQGFAVVTIETPEKRSLPSILVPALRSALLKLDKTAATNSLVKKAMRALASFVEAMKVKYHDIEFSIAMEKQSGVADSGDLEHDLMELFIALGNAAKERKTAFILCVDEIQYIQKEEFAALIMALHKCAQLGLPVLLIGAGLPQLIAQAGRAKSYAERLFEYPSIGPLDESAAKKALEIPAQKYNVLYEPAALSEILTKTEAYPYFLQEWGKHAWNVAEHSPITLQDVKTATELAILELDTNFFRVRFDRLSLAEKKYLRAMAEFNGSMCRSGDIASYLKKAVQTVAPTRASLIAKGMIYSLAHGENAFTVPLFGAYLKRVLPEKDA